MVQAFRLGLVHQVCIRSATLKSTAVKSSWLFCLAAYAATALPTIEALMHMASQAVRLSAEHRWCSPTV